MDCPCECDRFSLSGGFVIARADPGPRGQTLWGAEGLHVQSDLDDQHSRTHGIDSRYGLEKVQSPAVRLQFSQQLGVESSDTGLELTDVLEDFAQDESMGGSQITIECVEQLLGSGFEPGVGKLQRLQGCSALDQTIICRAA